MVRVSVYALLIAALLLATCGSLYAQDEFPQPDSLYRTEPVLVAGDKVRVTAPKLFPGILEGRVELPLPDTLIVEPKSTTATLIPLNSVSELAVSWGNKQIVGELLGGMLGAMLGGWVGSELDSIDETSNIKFNIFTVIGVVAGGLGGYFLGKQFDRWVFGEKWEEVPVSRVRWESRQQGDPSEYEH